MCLRASLAVVLAIFSAACGGTVASERAPDADADAAAQDARARDAGVARCFPDDPTSTAACPEGTLCNYAWGSGAGAVECAATPAECANDRSCTCLLAHPPAPPAGRFCGGRYCDVTDAG